MAQKKNLSYWLQKAELAPDKRAEHEYFFSQAVKHALQSTCLHFRMGALAVDVSGKIITGAGLGTPILGKECSKRHTCGCQDHGKEPLHEKYCKGVHPAIKILIWVGRIRLTGSSIYLVAFDHNQHMIDAKPGNMIINELLEGRVEEVHYLDGTGKKHKIDIGQERLI